MSGVGMLMTLFERTCSGLFHSDFHRSMMGRAPSSWTDSGTDMAEMGSVEKTWS